MSDFRVLFTDRKHPDLAIEREVLARIGATVVDATDEGPEFLERELALADAVCNQYAVLDAGQIDRMERARIISHYGIGTNRIDSDRATERGIWVANAPDYCTEEVAMHALALILGLERGITEYDRLYRGGTWTYDLGRPLHRISGRTLGLLGLGRIARKLAGYAAALGYRVRAYDPMLPDEAFVEAGVDRAVDVIDLVAHVDVLSIHTPLTDETRGMINAAVLAQARPGLLLVNAGRGAVIDEPALRNALADGRVVAGLDVLASEPPTMTDPMFSAPNTVLTPHAAFYSEEAYDELRRTVAENLVAFHETGRPLHAVNTPDPTATLTTSRGTHV